MNEIAIGLTPDKQYVLCSAAGKVIAGPFLDASHAQAARDKLGGKAKEELGKVDVIESSQVGLEGYFVRIDNLPYIRVKWSEDAAIIKRSFETGLIALIHKRFLGGLGDLIVLSGAAVTMAKIHGKLVLTSTSKYKKEFEKIFVDHPEITLDVVLSRAGEFVKSDISENLLLHDETISFVNTPLDEFERTYKHFGIPYEHRWSECPIESACSRVEQMAVPDRKYAFVHDDPDRGYRIDLERLPDLTCYHPSSFERESILEFKDLLENATEVHVIDSVFFHLVESLKPKGKLFFHRYSRPYNRRYNDYKTRYKWKVLV